METRFIYMMMEARSFCEPNITSGDSIKGDGLFSFRIPVYGTGFEDPNFQTKAGTFKWRFLAQDKSNDYSNMVEHEIVIQ